MTQAVGFFGALLWVTCCFLENSFAGQTLAAFLPLSPDQARVNPQEIEERIRGKIQAGQIDAALEDAVTSVLVMAVMQRVSESCRAWPSEEKYLIVDEAWTLLKSPASARFIENVSRTARKARLSLGDRVFVAIEYAAQDVVPGSGGTSVSGGTVGPGAVVEGTVKSIGDVTVVDCGAEVLVRGDTIQGVAPGESVRFAIADEGKAYLIPTR